MIVVAALGPLDVRDPVRGSLATLLAQPRRAALLAYLAVEGGEGFVSRDRLLGVFWPESDESRARASLRQTLAFLRRVLGADAIRTRGDDEVGVDPAHVRCDVWQLRERLCAGAVDEALAMYRGEFLAGLMLDDAPAFELWVSTARRTIARELAEATARAADRATEAGDSAAALRFAREASALSPVDEAAHRRLLTLLDGAGDRAGALREHEAFVALLARELDIAPSPETDAVVHRIRERDVPQVVASVHGRVETSSATPGRIELAEAPTARTVEPRPRAVESVAAPAFNRARLAAVVLAVLAVVVTMVALRRPTATSPEIAYGTELSARRIAVLPLSDPSDSTSPLGAMAADWIVEGLARLDGFEIVPLTAVLASEAAESRDTVRVASERWSRIAAELGAGVVVRGTVYREGGNVHLQVQLLETATKRIVRPVERVTVPSDSLMVGIDRLRTRVLASIAPLADSVTHLRRAVAPPTLEAYRDYVAGLQIFMRGDAREALRLYQRALDADSAWPMPRIAASIMHTNLGDVDSADLLVSSLRADRVRLGPLEAATLDMLDGLLIGDIAAAYDASVRQARIAPGSIGHYMVAETARRLGRPLEALSVLEELDPDRGELREWRPFWREKTYALHHLGRFAAEADAAREAIRRHPADLLAHSYLVRALAALGDTAGLMLSLDALDAVTSAIGARAEARANALTHVVRYQPTLGPTVGARFTRWFSALPVVERESPSVRLQEARVLLFLGRTREAHSALQSFGVELSPPSFVLGRIGIVAAAAGDTSGARQAVDALAAQAAALSPIQRSASWGEFTYWRAAIAAQLGEREQALELFRQARREGLSIDPRVLSEPAFAGLREWAPFQAALGGGG